MRIISSVIAFLFFSASALAETAISLPPLKGNETLSVDATENFTGTCGTSVVRVLGVKSVLDYFFTIDLDAGKIIIRGGKNKDMIIDATGILSDHNGVACISTKSGSRLVIWTNCAGSTCGDGFSFYVIDPDRRVFLAPQDPLKGSCDDKCASRLLENKLPQEITVQ